MITAHDLTVLKRGFKAERCDKKLHRKICQLTESSVFNGSIIFFIFLNALFMALETYDNIEQGNRKLFNVVDLVFLGIYTIEFLLKFYAEPINYWKSYYNLFDFLVLLISWVQSGISWVHSSDSNQLGALRVLRALRTLRTLRTVSFIRGLQVLVTALIDTIRKWVIHILILLLLLVFLFGIMGYYFFGYKNDVADKDNWGTLPRAMLTLFSFVTVDGWIDLQKELDVVTTWSRFFTILFIFLGHFIFTNIFIGVIIINISEATETYKRERRHEHELMLQHKKEFMMMRQHNEVKQMMERQKKGSYDNFAELVEAFEKALRHDDCSLVADLPTNLLWMETYMNTLDAMDDALLRCQQLQFEIANLLTSMMEAKLRAKKNPNRMRTQRRSTQISGHSEHSSRLGSPKPE